MVPLPPDARNPIDLADWLELSVLEADDRNASTGDLTSALTILSGDIDSDAAEELSLQVMREIEHRVKSAGEAYPFNIRDVRILELKGGWTDYVAYVFCLCLSFFGWRPTKGASINPWYLFEDLSAIAAREYIHGEVFKFGFEAAVGTIGFEAKIAELCRLLGEGHGFRKQNNLKRKDDKVDLVAWKNFKDERESKLIIFGQCAGGANWTGKMSEMQPDIFWKQWVQESGVSPLIRSFYIPFRLPAEEFTYTGRYSGILFERCRIAHTAWQANDEVLADHRYETWCKSVFAALESYE